MSETLVQRPTSVDLSSTHRQTPAREVIDVDTFYDEDIEIVRNQTHGAGSRRPTQLNASQDIIDVDELDEDIQVVGGPSNGIGVNAGNNGQGNRRRPARRVLFSPPPQRQDNAVPPVPPIPIHFREPPPLRYRPPPPDYAAGVFRPMDRPFPFENDLLANRINAHRTAERDVYVPPARNRHERRGNMGLGGAVLSLNRQRQLEEENARMRREQEGGNLWVNLHSDAFGLLRRFFMGGHVEGGHGAGWMDDEQFDLDILDGIAMSHAERAGQEPRRHRFGIGSDRLQRNAPVEYRSIYTHSQRPEPGFSNDFAPNDPITVDQAGPSNLASSEAGTILVCAKCLDPLVTNVTGSDDVVRKSRLWALRCGHMLDGKCVEELMKPHLMTETVVEAETPSGPSSSHQLDEGKGTKVVDGEQQDTGEQVLSPRRDKGKRKASALEDNDSYVPNDRKGKGRAHDTLQAIPNVTSEEVSAGASSSSTPAPTIRSRLRPRKLPSQTSEASTAEIDTGNDIHPVSAQVQDDEETPTPEHVPRATRGRRRVAARGRAVRRRVGGLAKGKGKALVPVVQAEHEWLCPVSTCQHKHWSVLINGVWKMDDERELGAVALYV